MIITFANNNEPSNQLWPLYYYSRFTWHFGILFRCGDSIIYCFLDLGLSSWLDWYHTEVEPICHGAASYCNSVDRIVIIIIRVIICSTDRRSALKTIRGFLQKRNETTTTTTEPRYYYSMLWASLTLGYIRKEIFLSCCAVNVGLIPVFHRSIPFLDIRKEKRREKRRLFSPS